jgi:hypothetical protein
MDFILQFDDFPTAVAVTDNLPTMNFPHVLLSGLPDVLLKLVVLWTIPQLRPGDWHPEE